MIPAVARATFNIRFNDQHTPATLEGRLREQLREIDDRYELTISTSGDSFVTSPGPLTQLLADAHRERAWSVPEHSTSGGTSDARFIKDICPVVEFGLVGQTMHQVDERVAVADLEALTRVYRAFLERYFRPHEPRKPMIPDQEEVLRSIFGAYRLAWLDRSGMGFFNLSVEGFWRSFFAAVVVAPGYALLVVQELMARPEEISAPWAFVVETLAYGVGWAAFPVVAIVLTHLLGLSRNYAAMIIAANWAAVIQIGVFLAAVGLSLLLPGFGGFAVTLATGAILFYQWFVIRTALDTSGGVAVALVLVDLLVNSAVNITADALV